MLVVMEWGWKDFVVGTDEDGDETTGMGAISLPM